MQTLSDGITDSNLVGYCENCRCRVMKQDGYSILNHQTYCEDCAASDEPVLHFVDGTREGWKKYLIETLRNKRCNICGNKQSEHRTDLELCPRCLYCRFDFDDHPNADCKRFMAPRYNGKRGQLYDQLGFS